MDIVLVKPKAFTAMNKGSIEGVIKADQRVISALNDYLTVGEEQLKALTGYDNDHLPKESPTRTSKTLDDITFDIVTNVRVNNPEYQIVFHKIMGFLEMLANDWVTGVRKDGVRTYEVDSVKTPFVRWDYLMWNIFYYTSRKTELGVTHEIEEIKGYPQLADMDLNRLVLNGALVEKPDITKKGAAQQWYLAKRFYDEVMSDTVEPFKEKMEEASGITEMPDETTKYWQQISNYLATLTTIPSPRRQYGKVINLLFQIPTKDKPKGSTELPVVPDYKNYQKLLDAYEPLLQTSLKKWKRLEGKIGELITLYYDLENEPRVKDEFPYLPEYLPKREDDKMFISVQALYSRLAALEDDYMKNRMLRKHSIARII